MLTLVARNKNNPVKGKTPGLLDGDTNTRQRNIVYLNDQATRAEFSRQKAIDAIKKRAELLHW